MPKITIQAKANANKTEIKEYTEEGIIKVRVAAVPEQGKANKELIKFLSKTFKVPQAEIQIISGHRYKRKVIESPITKEDIKAHMKQNRTLL